MKTHYENYIMCSRIFVAELLIGKFSLVQFPKTNFGSFLSLQIIS
jgi:hypothetical protein